MPPLRVRPMTKSKGIWRDVIKCVLQIAYLSFDINRRGPSIRKIQNDQKKRIAMRYWHFTDYNLYLFCMFCCEILRASCFLRWANAIFITAILTGVIFVWTLSLNGYPSKYDHPADQKCINCGREMQLFGQCCTYSTITEYDCVTYERCREMQLTGKANDDQFNDYGVGLIIAGSILEGLFILYLYVLFTKELKRRKNVERRLESLLANQQQINRSEVGRERPIRREEPIRREPIRVGVIRQPVRRQQREQVPVFVDSSTECSICLMEFDAFLPVINRDGCRHKFHNNCLRDWSKINPKCPICRRD